MIQTTYYPGASQSCIWRSTASQHNILQSLTDTLLLLLLKKKAGAHLMDAARNHPLKYSVKQLKVVRKRISRFRLSGWASAEEASPLLNAFHCASLSWLLQLLKQDNSIVVKVCWALKLCCSCSKPNQVVDFRLCSQFSLLLSAQDIRDLLPSDLQHVKTEMISWATNLKL